MSYCYTISKFQVAEGLELCINRNISIKLSHLLGLPGPCEEADQSAGEAPLRVVPRAGSRADEGLGQGMVKGHSHLNN